MKEAGRHYGIDFEVTQIKTGLATEEEAAQAAEQQEPSKPEEGDKPADKEQAGADDEAKPKGDLEPPEQADDKPEHRKLLKRIDKITARLRAGEDETKAAKEENKALKEELAEIRRKLASGEPKPEATPEPVDNTPKKPVRPVRPTLAKAEFDQERYEADLTRYDGEMASYEDALSAWTRAEAVREIQERQEREQRQSILEQDAHEWQSAIDARPGFREKLEAATDVMQSPAMETVARGIFNPAERAIIVEHLVDNPDEAERIMKMTLGREGKGKTTQAEWAYLQNLATKEFSAILKEATPAPKPKLVERAETPRPQNPTPPPAKPKPPVSAAPAPIEPVGGRSSAAQPRLDDPNVDFDAYRAQRDSERRNRFASQMGRR
jgi:hypothetical protein